MPELPADIEEFDNLLHPRHLETELRVSIPPTVDDSGILLDRPRRFRANTPELPIVQAGKARKAMMARLEAAAKDAIWDHAAADIAAGSSAPMAERAMADIHKMLRYELVHRPGKARQMAMLEGVTEEQLVAHIREVAHTCYEAHVAGRPWGAADLWDGLKNGVTQFESLGPVAETARISSYSSGWGGGGLGEAARVEAPLSENLARSVQRAGKFGFAKAAGVGLAASVLLSWAGRVGDSSASDGFRTASSQLGAVDQTNSIRFTQGPAL